MGWPWRQFLSRLFEKSARRCSDMELRTRLNSSLSTILQDLEETIRKSLAGKKFENQIIIPVMGPVPFERLVDFYPKRRHTKNGKRSDGLNISPIFDEEFVKAIWTMGSTEEESFEPADEEDPPPSVDVLETSPAWPKIIAELSRMNMQGAVLMKEKGKKGVFLNIIITPAGGRLCFEPITP